MAATVTHVDAKTADQNTQDKTLLDTFWLLADPSDDKRLKGASDLLQILIEKQKQHKKSKVSELYCSEVDYSLKRLVKGLASGRRGARLGYVTVLAELLQKVPRISVEVVLTLIQDHLVVKGKEDRDFVFGQVFAYLAIIQSGRLQRSDEKYTADVLQKLITLGELKSYLQAVCFKGVIDILYLTREDVFIDHIWPKLKLKLKVGWEACTADTLALLMVCHKRFPEVVKPKFIQSHYGHVNLVDKSNLHYIAAVFVKSTIVSHPNVHIACDMILSQMMQDKASLPQFWQQVVDESLCGARQECKYLALKLLERVLPICDAKLVRAVFSPMLLKVYINSMTNRQGFLHKAAALFSGNLPAIVAKIDGKAQLALIQCLLSSPGHILFDDITKSKTIHNLVSVLSADGVRLYLKWLKSLFVSGTAKIRLEPDLDGDRKWVCMQILSLIRNPNVTREDSWMKDASQFLLLHSFFNVRSPEFTIEGCQDILSKPVSEPLRRQITPYFYSAVQALSTNYHQERDSEQPSGPTEQRPMGTNSQGQLWVHVLVRYAQQLLQSGKVKMAEQFDEKSFAAWDKMYAMVEKIHKKRMAKSGITLGLPFELLFLHIGLQMLSDPKQSLEILEDLHECYSRALERRKSAKKTEGEDPDWVVVVIEILLSLLSKSSHLLRTVVDNVFKMICPHLTKEALTLLLNVLDPMGGAEVTNLEVADDSDEEMEGENVQEEEEEEEDSDDEDANKESKKSDDEEEDSEDSDDEDDDDGDGNPGSGEVNEALRASLKAALGDAAKDSGEDEGEESDDQYDDDHMIKVDTLLSRVFQQHKTIGMTRREMDNNVQHFKLRVLDLIDIFLKRQQTNPLILDMIEPLLVMAKVASGQKDNQILAEKAFRIYNKLCTCKRYPHGISDRKEELHQTMENVMQLAMKGQSVQMVSVASSACLFLMRILKGNAVVSVPSPLQTRRQRSKKKATKTEDDQETQPQTGLLDEDRIASLYSNALKDFMTRKGTCLHPLLFSDLIRRFPHISWQLTDQLIKYITEGAQLYRKTQACHLLSVLLANRPFVGEEETWPAQSKRLIKTIEEALQSVCGQDSDIKPKFLVQILQLVKEYAMLGHYMKNKKSANFTSVKTVLGEIKVNPSVKKCKDNKEIQTAITNALAAIDNRSIKGQKRKRDKRKKKPKKKSKASRKSRAKKMKLAQQQ